MWTLIFKVRYFFIAAWSTHFFLTQFDNGTFLYIHILVVCRSFFFAVDLWSWYQTLAIMWIKLLRCWKQWLLFCLLFSIIIKMFITLVLFDGFTNYQQWINKYPLYYIKLIFLSFLMQVETTVMIMTAVVVSCGKRERLIHNAKSCGCMAFWSIFWYCQRRDWYLVLFFDGFFCPCDCWYKMVSL